VEVRADLRPVRRIDLTVGEPLSRGSVRGTVVDEDGRTVADANVLVDGLSEGGTTGTDGRFQLVDVPLGSRMMVARKVGHVPVYRPLDVTSASAGDLVLRLERGVTLEGVKVRARANVSRDRREFDERRLAGQAQLLDSTQLRNFTSLQTALRSYPSLNVVTANNGTEFALRGRMNRPMRRCRVYVWMDGILADEEALRQLPLKEIAATELFTSDAFAPARFRTFGDSCAVLLVWTRNFLRQW
jgi:hypothetical protein